MRNTGLDQESLKITVSTQHTISTRGEETLPGKDLPIMATKAGESMVSATAVLSSLGYREYHADGGGIIVFQNDIPVLVADNQTIVDAYYAGIFEAMETACHFC